VDLHTDFLIIGSGIAGLRAAVELAGAGSVLILTKAEPRDGNTGYAQGGIAAAVGPGIRRRCMPPTPSRRARAQ
jgi:L-aspartate oxidase